MKVIKEKIVFQPITIAIETKEELEAFIDNMRCAHSESPVGSTQEDQANEILLAVDSDWG